MSLPYSGGLDQPLQCLRLIFFCSLQTAFGTEIHLGVKRWDSECKVCYVGVTVSITAIWLPALQHQRPPFLGATTVGPNQIAVYIYIHIDSYRHTYILELIENGRQHTSWPGLINDFC